MEYFDFYKKKFDDVLIEFTGERMTGNVKEVFEKFIGEYLQSEDKETENMSLLYDDFVSIVSIIYDSSIITSDVFKSKILIYLIRYYSLLETTDVYRLYPDNIEYITTDTDDLLDKYSDILLHVLGFSAVKCVDDGRFESDVISPYDYISLLTMLGHSFGFITIEGYALNQYLSDGNIDRFIEVLNTKRINSFIPIGSTNYGVSFPEEMTFGDFAKKIDEYFPNTSAIFSFYLEDICGSSNDREEENNSNTVSLTKQELEALLSISTSEDSVYEDESEKSDNEDDEDMSYEDTGVLFTDKELNNINKNIYNTDRLNGNKQSTEINSSLNHYSAEFYSIISNYLCDMHYANALIDFMFNFDLYGKFRNKEEFDNFCRDLLMCIKDAADEFSEDDMFNDSVTSDRLIVSMVVSIYATLLKNYNASLKLQLEEFNVPVLDKVFEGDKRLVPLFAKLYEAIINSCKGSVLSVFESYCFIVNTICGILEVDYAYKTFASDFVQQCISNLFK